MVKNLRELKHLKKQYEEELKDFEGSNGDRKKTESKLRKVNEQLKVIAEEDNTK